MPAFAVVALLAAQGFDFVSFLAMVAQHGVRAEANPIVVELAQATGLPGVTIAKVAIIVLTASTTAIVSRQSRRLAVAVLFAGIAGGVVGGLSNVLTLTAWR